MRRYVTLYSDSYADDEPSPIDAPRRSAWGPGIYFTQIPKLRRLDLRVESYSTWLFREDDSGAFIYWDSRYWISGNSFVESQYKQIKTGSAFLPGGGTQTDLSINGQLAYQHQWLFAVWLQAERYDIPILGLPRHDLAGSLQVTFTPRNWAIGKDKTAATETH